MRTAHLIIDGYCLLHRDPELQPLLRDQWDLARHRLVTKISAICSSLADHTTIVFDGAARSLDPAASAAGIDVIYSARGETADTVIETMSVSAARPDLIRVVTSDRAEIDVVLAAGAQVMSCAEFLDRCTEASQRATDQFRRQSRATPRNRIGDHFPEEKE